MRLIHPLDLSPDKTARGISFETSVQRFNKALPSRQRLALLRGWGSARSQPFPLPDRAALSMTMIDYGLAHTFPVSRSAISALRHDSAARDSAGAARSNTMAWNFPIYSFSVMFQSM